MAKKRGRQAEQIIASEINVQEERKVLIQMENEASKSFDMTLVTLSSGALGLSLTFIKTIAPIPKPDSVWFLYSAWIALIVSLITILISFLASQAAIRKQRDYLHEYCLNATFVQPDDWRARATRWLNRLSLAMLILGVILITVFVTWNLPNVESFI